MASRERHTTKYSGVFYQIDRKGNRTFFVRYKLQGSRKHIEERAGSEIHGMTAAKANLLRSERLSGKSNPNTQRKLVEKAESSKNQWTLAKLWEEYAATRSSDPARPYKSLGADEDRFNKHFSSISQLQPEQIDHINYERWKRNIAKGRSPTTVCHCGELLRRIVRFGTERNLCNGLPFKLSLKKPDNRTTEYLEREQLNQLIEALKLEEPITGNLFTFALFTGLRRGELLRLEWSDINFEQGIVQLRDTKAGKDQTLPLSEKALSLLENHPRHQSGCDYVFPSPQGCQWSRSSLDRVFKRIASRSNLPEGFRLLHGLRHQYGSMLAENGANIVELRDLLRHSDVRVSERYLHSSDEHLRKRINLLGNQLESLGVMKIMGT
uniref:Integrase n=1 Tax=uncultured delta proteobacterium HF0070_07E19 TaxID=710823 RepID=E0XXB1_9DELT|nr:integrase [uncultured delta proteobacterium HF0070_07E19]